MIKTSKTIKISPPFPGGGVYGMNVETLAADKTLTPNTDKIYQYLDEGGANRIITLATAGATAGDRFVIRHNGAYSDTHYLEVRQAAITLDKIYAGSIKEFIFDGTNWVSGGIGTGENDDKKYNVGIGYDAKGYIYGVAIGYSASGYDHGVAIGYLAKGESYGVAIGFSTNSNAKRYSIALGTRSKCERVAETSININGDSVQKYNAVQGRWSASIAGGAGATEIFCGGQANARFTIRNLSHLAFRITVVARDNVANEGAMYTFEGLIKRDGAGNTVMSVCNKVVGWVDDTTWDCAVTADDINEALIITCTPDGTNVTQWVAVLEGGETHF